MIPEHKTASLPVRLAVAEDRESIFGLIRMLHQENGLFPLSERKMQAHVDKALALEASMIGVIGPLGEPEGGILIDLEQPYYSDEFQITELFNFVHPKHRKSQHAKSLIRFAMMCADQMGVPFITGIVTNDRMVAKARLYRDIIPAPESASSRPADMAAAELVSALEELVSRFAPKGPMGSKDQLTLARATRELRHHIRATSEIGTSFYYEPPSLRLKKRTG